MSRTSNLPVIKRVLDMLIVSLRLIIDRPLYASGLLQQLKVGLWGFISDVRFANMTSGASGYG